MSRNRPMVLEVGKVAVRSGRFVIFGWHLTLCASACLCHKNPKTGKLVAEENRERATLGLVSYKPHCTCCEPWTAEELRYFLDSLAKVDKVVAESAAKDPK